MNDPAFWSGLIDSKLGICLQDRPIRKIAMCLGIGVIVGLVIRFPDE